MRARSTGEEFIERLNAGVKLRRSFVAPSYQRSYQPLLLLWKAIGAFLNQRPELRFLFGPVSISQFYHPLSRDLMVKFLARTMGAGELEKSVHPRKPWRRPALLPPAPTPADFEEMESLVSDLEPGRKGPLVLLRQYLKLGGRIAAFNVDPAFGNALDGLIVVDLERAPAKALERLLARR